MKKGFTLLELLITCVIIGIISSIGISNVWKNIPSHEVAENIKTVEQALRRGRSIAIRESRVTIVDFSQATSNHGLEGGLINIKRTDGTIISTLSLSINNLLDSGETTIENSEVRFDYLGQPVDDTGSHTSFNTNNNTISIGSYRQGSLKASKKLTVEPMTGWIEIS